MFVIDVGRVASQMAHDNVCTAARDCVDGGVLDDGQTLQVSFLCPTKVRSTAVFFFQAADGIPAWCVTGVQTCALPIGLGRVGPSRAGAGRVWQVGDQKSGGEGKSVELGGRRIIKKKKKEEEEET